MALIDIRLDEDDDSNIDGLKILEWIKMNKPEISAFVMNAYKEFNYAEQALNLGAKPIWVFEKMKLFLYCLFQILIVIYSMVIMRSETKKNLMVL